jgi:ABC-2 type transport system permease protein
LLKNRLFLGITMAFLFRDLTGLDSPVEIATAIVGEGQVIPWEERLLPVIVLMTIILGGIMVPATSLVEEKQNRTLGALVITPASLNYVFAAKGLLGAILSFFVAIVVLVLNGAVGTQPLLLAMVLGLAASLGLLLSASMKDVDTLFAVIKATGILLYAPAIVYLFPGIPQWIGKLFPTYYLIAPVFEISQQGATWSDVALDVFILAGLIVVMLGTVAFAARRLGRQGT